MGLDWLTSGIFDVSQHCLTWCNIVVLCNSLARIKGTGESTLWHSCRESGERLLGGLREGGWRILACLNSLSVLCVLWPCSVPDPCLQFASLCCVMIYNSKCKKTQFCSALSPYTLSVCQPVRLCCNPLFLGPRRGMWRLSPFPPAY